MGSGAEEGPGREATGGAEAAVPERTGDIPQQRAVGQGKPPRLHVRPSPRLCEGWRGGGGRQRETGTKV